MLVFGGKFVFRVGHLNFEGIGRAGLERRHQDKEEKYVFLLN